MDNPAPSIVSIQNEMPSISRGKPSNQEQHESLQMLLTKLSSLRVGDYEGKYIQDLQRSAEALSSDTVSKPLMTSFAGAF